MLGLLPQRGGEVQSASHWAMAALGNKCGGCGMRGAIESIV